MTGRDLLSESLRKIGALANGESLTASELVNGLVTINNMLKSWNISPLLIFKVTSSVFSLVAGQQSYTMGTGGNFNAARPTKIARAGIVIGTQEYPLEIITVERWAEIQDKSSSGEIPQYLYAEGTYPLETVNLWPKPSQAHSIALYTHTPLTAITANDDIEMPDGYLRAIISNGGIELCPEYGRQATPELIKVASESLAAIKKKNSKPRLMKSDAFGINSTGKKSGTSRISGE